MPPYFPAGPSKKRPGMLEFIMNAAGVRSGPGGARTKEKLHLPSTIATLKVMGRLFAAVLFSALAAFAQLSTSSITGTVTDPQGLATPGASVTAVNEDTGASFSAETTSTGNYAITGLIPGPYTVNVSHAGFRNFTATHNRLNVGAPIVVDIHLQLGASTESVQVEASYARVETSNATISDVITQRNIQTLPLNGRNPLNLIALEPGVVQRANSTTGTQVNGARSNAVNLTLDGIDINEISVPNAQKNVYNLNTSNVQEFRIVTHNATADFGKNSGANVAITSRSGSKQFHGDVYEYFRNPVMNANEWFSNAQGLPKPDYKLNQYGGDAGGPLPGGKTFWFASWQGQRFTVSKAFTTGTVYTPSMRAGNFRYVVGTVNGQTKAGTSLVDSHTGQLLPGIATCGGSVTTNCVATANLNAIGATATAAGGGPYQIDPAMAKFFNAAPLPNLYLGGDGLNTAQFVWNRPSQDPQERIMGRIDHQFDAMNSVFFRFIWSRDATKLGDPINGGYQAFPGYPVQEISDRRPMNLAANYRRVLTPHLVNSFTAGLARFEYGFPNNFTNDQFPTIPPYSVANVYNPFTNPTAGGLTNQSGVFRWLTSFQYVDDVTWEHGKHLVSGGFNFRFQRQNDHRSAISPTIGAPVVTFSGSGRDPSQIMTLPTMNSTDLATFKNAIDEWMGLPYQQSLGFFAAGANSYIPSNTYVRGERMHQYNAYIQDQWKVRRDLTMSIGTRWEYNPPGSEANGLIFRPNVRPDQWSPSAPVSYSQASHYWDRQNANVFGPRLGLAWNPSGSDKTVVRAGFGIYNDTFNTYQLVPFTGAIPGGSINCTTQITYASGKPVVTPSNNCGVNTNPTAQISNGYGVGLPNPAVPPSGFFTPAPSAKGVAPQASQMDPNVKIPTTQQWNLSVQRDLGRDTVLEVSYVGSHSTHLSRGYDLNQLNLSSNFLNSFNTARSNLVKCGNVLGTASCGAPVGLLQTILGSTLSTTTATTPLLNNSAAGLAQTIDTTYFTQMVAATGNAGYFRPNPQFGTILYFDTNGNANYNALQARLRRHATDLDFGIGYTWGKAIDDGSSDPVGSTAGGGASSSHPTDIHNFALDRGRADFDRRHSMTAYYVWQLPVGKGHRFLSRLPWAVNEVISGWQTSGIVTYMTGEPFSVSSGILTADNIRSSRATINGATPAVTMNYGVAGNPGPYVFSNSVLNAATSPFGIADAGSNGNQGRNIFTGPAFFNSDMTLIRQFKFREKYTFDFRLDAFNVFNHANFRIASATAFTGTTLANGVVLPTVSTTFAGTCCTSAYLPSSASATGVGEPPRVMQASLKVSF